jgi:two-component system response regulator ChvI
METAQGRPRGGEFRIFVVEGDRLIRESLCLELAARGYRIAEFGDAEEALARLGEGAPADGMVLDARLAEAFEGDPRAELAAARVLLPIVILAEPGGRPDVAARWGTAGVLDRSRSVAALCDDLVRHLEEPGRVRPAALASSPAADDLVFDDERGRAFWKGRQLDLTEAELVLLRGLAGPDGEDLTYLRGCRLLEAAAVTGGPVNRELFQSLVKRLRKKFREVDPDFDWIAYLPERGYRWRGHAGRTAGHVLRTESV